MNYVFCNLDFNFVFVISLKITMNFKEIKHLKYDATGVSNPEDWNWELKGDVHLPQTRAVSIPSTLVRKIGKLFVYKT
jgi:hypothetical protein